MSDLKTALIAGLILPGIVFAIGLLLTLFTTQAGRFMLKLYAMGVIAALLIILLT